MTIYFQQIEEYIWSLDSSIMKNEDTVIFTSPEPLFETRIKLVISIAAIFITSSVLFILDKKLKQSNTEPAAPPNVAR